MANLPKKPGAKAKRASFETPGPVGPGRPPLHSRFAPGVSGNPKGRPRKERSLLKLIEAELDAEVPVTENGERQRLSKREVLAKQLVNKALQGDAKDVTALIRLIGSGSDNQEGSIEAVDPATILAYLQRATAQGGGQ